MKTSTMPRLSPAQPAPRLSQATPLLIVAPYSPQLAGGSRTMLDLVHELGRRGLRCIVASTRASPLLAQLEARQIETVVVPPPPVLELRAERALAQSPLRKLQVLAAALSYN